MLQGTILASGACNLDIAHLLLVSDKAKKGMLGQASETNLIKSSLAGWGVRRPKIRRRMPAGTIINLS